jgi:hypothetical protein
MQAILFDLDGVLGYRRAPGMVVTTHRVIFARRARRDADPAPGRDRLAFLQSQPHARPQ